VEHNKIHGKIKAGNNCTTSRHTA